MPNACVVPKCKSGARSMVQKCSVFKVPRNIEQFKKWQAAIPGVTLKQTQFVCEKHFDESCIIRQWIGRDDNGAIIAQTTYERPRLNEFAVPTIFEDSQTVQSASSTCLECKDEPIDYICDTAQFSEFCDMSMEGTTLMDVAKVATVTEKKHSEPQDLVCPQAEKNYPPEFVQPPNLTLAEEIHEDHDYVQQAIVSPEHSMKKEILSPNRVVKQKGLQASEANATACSTVPPRRRNFGIADIKMNDGNIVVTLGPRKRCFITIPKFWGCKELATERGQSMVFTRLESKRENGAEVPVIERSVIVDPDNRLRYSLCGHAIDLEKRELDEVLEETSLLPVALEKFKRMKSCSGLGAVNIHYLPADSVFKDCLDRWRDNNCKLLSKEKRCEECKRMRQRILRREMRSNKDRTAKRVLRALNPIDEKKLLALRKKNERERRLKHRAKQRVQLLLQSSRGRADKIASISAETLEGKCSACSISGAQHYRSKSQKHRKLCSSK